MLGFFHSKVTQLQDLRAIANLSYSFVADSNTMNLNFTKQSSKYFIGNLASGRPKTARVLSDEGQIKSVVV